MSLNGHLKEFGINFRTANFEESIVSYYRVSSHGKVGAGEFIDFDFFSSSGSYVPPVFMKCYWCGWCALY